VTPLARASTAMCERRGILHVDLHTTLAGDISTSASEDGLHTTPHYMMQGYRYFNRVLNAVCAPKAMRVSVDFSALAVGHLDES
jgi:hypothetical protein